MSYFLLAVSSGSSVLQNTLFNKVAKKYLKCSGDVYRYHIFLNLVCVILFLSVAALEKFPFSLYSLVLGTVFGIVTAFSSVFKVKALANGPMHITVLITTSSMLLPTVSGVFISGEHFSAYRMLAAAVLAVVLYGFYLMRRIDGYLAKKPGKNSVGTVHIINNGRKIHK